mmetsp:Transcript_3953/g.10212  ORF Transcript_3953/g.10212 Transcript_3953/m.10212 type:complete len:281 (+) Transcript_3953:111-953(+)
MPEPKRHAYGCEWMPLLSVEDVFQSRELWELPEEASVSRPPHDAGWRLGKKVALVAVVLTAAALCISVLGLQADGATSRGRDSDRVAIASAEPRTVKLAAAPNDLLLPGRPCYFAWQEKVDGGARQAMCFCQLAGNEGCRKKACACPQGCSGHTIVHPNSVTFRNFAQAQQCASTTALLTIPKSYFRDVNYLRSWCPAGAVSLLAEMIREGFAAYQVQVAGKRLPSRPTIPWASSRPSSSGITTSPRTPRWTTASRTTCSLVRSRRGATTASCGRSSSVC